MSEILGLWKLDTPIYCKKEVSGKEFETEINGVKLRFMFPFCPKKLDMNNNSFENGDLIAPIGKYQNVTRWGTIHAWPEGLFSVEALMCTANGTEEDIQKIYEGFPKWKEKFSDLHLIEMGKYMEPIQKPIALMAGSLGIYNGLELLISNDDKFIKIPNLSSSVCIKLDFTKDEECYTYLKMKYVFENAGSDKDIALAYRLMIVSYNAMLRSDFRSAIIIGATALEQSILHKMEIHYKNKRLNTFEKDKKKYSMLKRRFGWLKRYSIPIPVKNYKKLIIDIRNETTHDGKNHSYTETKTYLNNCKILIEQYQPNILED